MWGDMTRKRSPIDDLFRQAERFLKGQGFLKPITLQQSTLISSFKVRDDFQEYFLIHSEIVYPCQFLLSAISQLLEG